MREVTIFSNPVATPGVCAKCGSQDKEWFVDVGFDIDYNQALEAGHNIWLDGVLYLCCDCINGLVVDTHRYMENTFKKSHYVETEFVYGPRVSDEVSNEPSSDDSESESSSDESGSEFAIKFGAA